MAFARMNVKTAYQVKRKAIHQRTNEDQRANLAVDFVLKLRELNMGGVGSGRGYRSRNQTTIEETKRIDVRYLKKRGFLKPGISGSLAWNVRGEPSGNIRFSTEEHQLNLSYRCREYGDDWKPVKQTIRLARTDCNYGGYRTWLCCPRCNTRVGILCCNGKLFLCRHCYELPYGSQMETRIDRMIRAKQKLESRIFIPDTYQKAKGMHQSTYKELFSQWITLESQIDEAIFSRLRT